LADSYYNIIIEEDSKQHSMFLISIGYSFSYIIQPDNLNAPATIVRGMFDISKAMVFKDLVIYINIIIIFSDTQSGHVATLPNLLQRLLDNLL